MLNFSYIIEIYIYLYNTLSLTLSLFRFDSHRQLMAKGASQPWQEVLEETLGEGRLDGSALREYFAPLEEWLRQESLRTNEYVGWNYDGDYCKRSIETAGLQIFGGYYNGDSRPLMNLLLLTLSGWLSYLTI